ncbi:MAG: matrixin family metalloprotease [Deltaproteobacteria bacterium]|nr:matrixin family metalloprotease [Deltaproteobacteria bacterium]
MLQLTRYFLKLSLVFSALIFMSCGSPLDYYSQSHGLCQNSEALASGYLVTGECHTLSWGGSFPITLNLDQNLPPIFFQAFEKAINTWHSALGRSVFQLRTGLSNSNNVKLLAQDEWKNTGGEDLQQARTVYRYEKNKIVDFNILFNNVLQYSLDINTNTVHLTTLITHELGHVLGLAHTQGGLMNAILPNGVERQPEHSDIQKIVNLYFF